MNLDQLRDSDPWTWEIIAAKPRVAARPRRSSARQWTGKVRSRRGSHPSTALTSTATNGRRPLAMMMPRPTDGNPQARRITSARPATAPSGPHWYVDNVFAPGYCAACNTPRENRRHVSRAA